MATYKMSWTVLTPTGSKVVSKELTASGQVEIDPTFATGTTDGELAFALDVEACVFFMISSDQAVTIEANDGSGAGGTLTLAANVPYVWCTGDPTNLSDVWTADITKLYVTNASGSTATVSVRALWDATP